MTDNSTWLDEQMMFRCLHLAKQGKYYAPPNPLVGAVLVHDGKIIGEGYHQRYGEAHAEVNCINSVKDADKLKIPASTLYVSLEPCAHYGKTPPCADLIIHHKIPKVIIGCRDSFREVNGKGIEKLKQAGICVNVGVLEEACIELNRIFFVFNKEQRPYIILKWAQTADRFIGNIHHQRLKISNDVVNKLVHEWRAEVGAILVGTNTVMKDNPHLTNRSGVGKNPVRLIIDKKRVIPKTAHVFDHSVSTIIFNEVQHEKKGETEFVQFRKADDLISSIMKYCYQHQLQTVLVEGGSKLLNSFIDKNLWDEARVITANKLQVQDGIPAPHPIMTTPYKTEHIFDNTIEYFWNAANTGN